MFCVLQIMRWQQSVWIGGVRSVYITGLREEQVATANDKQMYPQVKQRVNQALWFCDSDLA